MGEVAALCKVPAEGPGDDVARLLLAARAGDQDAWTRLVGLYARRLFALARSRLRDDAAAEEIVQSVFVTVAGQIGRGGYNEQGRFEAWLFRVAMNRVRDEVRRRKRRGAMHAGPGALGVVAAEESGDSRADGVPIEALRAALGQLSDADREVVELRHHGGLSFNQMSALLEEPVGTLLARHHRALKKLRAILEQNPLVEPRDGE